MEAGAVLARRVAAILAPNRLPVIRSVDDLRWHSVTVNAPMEEVVPDRRLPQPLADLGASVEVRVRPAPDAKGTELHARPVEGGGRGEDARPGGTSAGSTSAGGTAVGGGIGEGGEGPAARAQRRELVRRIRAALRVSKQLIETGEVLQPDRPGTAKPTPLDAPVRYLTRHGREEGRL